MDGFKELACEMLSYYNASQVDDYLNKLMQNLKRFIHGGILINAYKLNNGCVLISISMGDDNYSKKYIAKKMN